jgi:hypothetical protein
VAAFFDEVINCPDCGKRVQLVDCDATTVGTLHSCKGAVSGISGRSNIVVSPDIHVYKDKKLPKEKDVFFKDKIKKQKQKQRWQR